MTPLRSLDLSLRVITPMACGNADFLAEVRPPSFRGAARLWLRILLGGIFGEDYAAVRAVENCVFGDTTHRSSFAVRTLDSPATGPLPGDPAEAPGLAYLYKAISPLPLPAAAGTAMRWSKAPSGWQRHCRRWASAPRPAPATVSGCLTCPDNRSWTSNSMPVP